MMTARENTERNRRDVALLAAVLPDFIDMVQHQLAGSEVQAALSLLAAAPPGGDTTLMQRYGKQIEWAIAAYGMAAVRDVAAQARDLPAGAEKNAKTDELATMLDANHADARVNEILEKLQQGQPPTDQDIRILAAAKNLYRE